MPMIKDVKTKLRLISKKFISSLLHETLFIVSSNNFLSCFLKIFLVKKMGVVYYKIIIFFPVTKVMLFSTKFLTEQ